MATDIIQKLTNSIDKTKKVIKAVQAVKKEKIAVKEKTITESTKKE